MDELARRWVHLQEGRCKATWKRGFNPPWREAGPPNHHDDKVDSDLPVPDGVLEGEVGDDALDGLAREGVELLVRRVLSVSQSVGQSVSQSFCLSVCLAGCQSVSRTSCSTRPAFGRARQGLGSHLK